MRNRERRPCKPNFPRTLHRQSRKRPLLSVRLLVEPLEARSLLAVSVLNAMGGSQVEPNNTLDRAQVLGDLSTLSSTDVVGTISNSTSGAAEVDWYSFTLDGPAHVTLDLQSRGSDHPLNGVLSLYNNDQFDFQDLYNPTGYRLLTQDVGAGGANPRVVRDLGPGTYEVAVSGAGNLDFHPLLAGSGFAGATGEYDLQLGAGALTVNPTNGPAVLTSVPAANAVLDSSPFVIRLDFGSALDPSTVIAGQTVRLTYNPNGSFGDGNDQDVPLAWTNVGVGGTELQLAPAAPLAPGSYRVSLAGDSTAGTPVVADLNGIPLGASDANPLGQGYSETFQVGGIEGNAGAKVPADDTAVGAHDLGNITTTASLIRIAGAIGDDPFYDNSDPAHYPGNDVNLYHFQISGPGRYAFLAEVFAGRIGSPLDPGVSLYVLDPADHRLHFLAGNNNTANSTPATDLSTPLFFDAMLSQGLTAGDYYIAISSGFNAPSPGESQPVDAPGLFDPNTSHTGLNGSSTGPYVLNLLVHATPDPPQVVSTSLAEGATLDQPPTRLTVQFGTPVNLEQIAYRSFLATNNSSVPSIYIQGPDGTKYYPKVDSYDSTSNEYTLLMLDRLPSGSFTLHLSGPGGLADLGGNPLAGNDSSGDFVVHFTVTATDPVQGGNSGSGGVINARPGPDGTQDLGVLFPHELQGTLTLDYNSSENQAQSPGIGQQYRFTLLQDTTYGFTLQGNGLPQGAKITLLDDTGLIRSSNAGKPLFGYFLPGSYVLTVQGIASDSPYQIIFKITGNADNPVPLFYGPAPALQLHFDSIALPSTPPTPGGGTTPVVVNPPVGSGNGSGDSNTVVFDPSPFGPTGTPGSTTAPGIGIGIGGVTPSPILVTLTLPADDFGSPTAGPVGGPSTVVTSATSLAIADHSAAVAGNSVANLASANLVGLGVGPVGGVQQSGGAVAATQAIQVTLQVPTNLPVPMGLVSLVTLTQTGELGDMIGPEDHAELDLAVAVAADLPHAPAAAPAPAPAQAGPVQRVEEVLREIAGWRAQPRHVAPAVDNKDDAAPAVQITNSALNGLAMGAGEGEGMANVGDTGIVDVDSLATAEGPWFFVLAALGAVIVYARRRQARHLAAASRSGDGDQSHATQQPFRLWGPAAARRLSHAIWSQPKPHIAVATSPANACFRPRHMNNP